MVSICNLISLIRFISLKKNIVIVSNTVIHFNTFNIAHVLADSHLPRGEKFQSQAFSARHSPPSSASLPSGFAARDLMLADLIYKLRKAVVSKRLMRTSWTEEDAAGLLLKVWLRFRPAKPPKIPFVARASRLAARSASNLTSSFRSAAWIDNSASSNCSQGFGASAGETGFGSGKVVEASAKSFARSSSYLSFSFWNLESGFACPCPWATRICCATSSIRDDKWLKQSTERS